MSPIHLRPTAPIAPDVLLPGDPGRALALAQILLTEPRMANHARGLWGYSGETPAGATLSIQSTGMGGPSAAIVFTELTELGVKRAVRVGTCGAFSAGLELGDVLAVTETLAADGTSAQIGINADGRCLPDPALTEALTAEGGKPAVIATSDLFYDDPEAEKPWIDGGAVAVEMEAATLFALGAKLGVAVGCLLVVSDLLIEGERTRIADEPLAKAAEKMGRTAAAALAAR